MVTLLAACGGAPAPAGDTVPPTVTLASSASTINTPSTLTLTATASDNVGVSKVEFFEEQNKLGEDTTAPFDFNIPLSATNNGAKKYSAKAFDAAGNFNSSSSILVNVFISTSGSMQFSFQGLFGSVPPNVLVRGPGGFEQKIISFGNPFLQNLVPGIYTVTAENLRAPSTLVDFVHEPRGGGEVEVKAGATTQLPISYSPRSGTGLLWVPVFGDHKLSGFNPFISSPSLLNTAIGTGANAFPNALTFDRVGNLWVTNTTSHALVRLPASDLVSSGTIAGVVAVANLGLSEAALPAFSPAPANLPIQ